jgi:hypothetical protein
MFAWFLEWTTQLNQTNHLAFAIATVLTMAGVGIGIAVLAEVLLKQFGAARSGAPEHHH